MSGSSRQARSTPSVFSACPSSARAPTARAIADRLLARGAGLVVAGQQHLRLPPGRQHPRPGGGRRLGRHEPHRVLVGADGGLAVTGRPQVAPEPLAQLARGRSGSAASSAMRIRAAARALSPARLAASAARRSRVDAIRPRGRRRVLDARPRGRAPGRSGRSPRRSRGGARPCPPRRPNARSAGSSTPAADQWRASSASSVAASAASSAPVGERGAVRGVQAVPLAREQRGVGGLAQQRVAEQVEVTVDD